MFDLLFTDASILSKSHERYPLCTAKTSKDYTESMLVYILCSNFRGKALDFTLLCSIIFLFCKVNLCITLHLCMKRGTLQGLRSRKTARTVTGHKEVNL